MHIIVNQVISHRTLSVTGALCNRATALPPGTHHTVGPMEWESSSFKFGALAARLVVWDTPNPQMFNRRGLEKEERL